MMLLFSSSHLVQLGKTESFLLFFTTCIKIIEILSKDHRIFLSISLFIKEKLIETERYMYTYELITSLFTRDSLTVKITCILSLNTF